MKKILIFILAFSMILPLGLSRSATDEGYGENETALGQFVDSFETSGNVSVAVNVIRNTTLEAMELNFIAGIPLDENYSAYTELDPNGRFTVSDNIIVVEGFTNFDVDHRIVFDYGVGYFTDFQHDLEARARDTGGTAGNDRMYVWMLANVSDDSVQAFDAGEEFIGLYFTEFDVSDPNNPEISLREAEDSVFYIDKFEPAARNVWYYFRINKTGTSLVAGIYSTNALRNAGDGTDGDIDNLALTLQEDWNFRYIYAINSAFSGFASTRVIAGDIHNLTIGRVSGGFDTDGYFTTVDYLSDPLANGSALVHLTNTSIPDGTGILVEFSEDNSTWIFNDWRPIFGGFESIDLRDLNYSTGFYIRYNLSTSNPAITPRVYQSRLITMIGQAGTPGGPNVLNGTWIDYNLTEIAVTRGTLDSGNLASTYFIDGDMFNVSEVAMAPGMTVLANITGIDDNAISLWITIYALYDGNLNHDFDIEVWDFTNSVWVEDSHIEDGVAMEWVNSTIYDLRIPVDFLNAGEVRIRLDHESPGNINHDLFIDYFRVQAFVPTGLAVAGVGAGANWGLLWFFLILICVPILLVLLKGSKR